MLKIQQALCIINFQKPGSEEIAKQAIDFLAAHGVTFFAPKGEIGFSAHDLSILEQALQDNQTMLQAGEGQKVDIAFIFGGDGTLIHSSRVLALFGIPIIGINLGKLGFLAAIELNCLEDSLEKLISGKFFLEERLLLWGEVERDGVVVMQSSAQNDIVVNNSSISRTINIDMKIDGQLALSFGGDGLVIATPTGSTAYSLSAGGPIVLPNSQLIVATPISPHNFFARPMIANADSKIEVDCTFINKMAQVTFDGQSLFQLQHGDKVMIRRSRFNARFVWIENSMFLNNLHRKMGSGM